MPSVTITNVTETKGAITIEFGKRSYTFPSRAALKSWASSAAEDETLVKMAVAYWLQRDSALSTVSSVRGKRITLDMSNAQNILQVTNG